jgi:transcriptional regulator with XRE-family HTH domain
MPTLKEVRLSKLWSQRELARRSGVAERTIVAIEQGDRTPRLVTMRKLAEALGVDWREVAEFRAAVAVGDGGSEEKAAA